jgi:hypothetical protein
MDNLTDDVKSLRLDSLFLPGTHDSGAYDTTQNYPIYFEKYVYTQVSLSLGFFVFLVSYIYFKNV